MLPWKRDRRLVAHGRPHLLVTRARKLWSRGGGGWTWREASGTAFCLSRPDTSSPVGVERGATRYRGGAMPAASNQIPCLVLGESDGVWLLRLVFGRAPIRPMCLGLANLTFNTAARRERTPTLRRTSGGHRRTRSSLRSTIGPAENSPDTRGCTRHNEADWRLAGQWCTRRPTRYPFRTIPNLEDR